MAENRDIKLNLKSDDNLTLEWIRQGYGLPPLNKDGKINRRMMLEKLVVKGNKNIKLKVKRKPRINKAHWIMDDDDILGLTYWCNACGYETEKTSKYCPSCGSNMEEN